MHGAAMMLPAHSVKSAFASELRRAPSSTLLSRSTITSFSFSDRIIGSSIQFLADWTKLWAHDTLLRASVGTDLIPPAYPPLTLVGHNSHSFADTTQARALTTAGTCFIDTFTDLLLLPVSISVVPPGRGELCHSWCHRSFQPLNCASSKRSALPAVLLAAYMFGW